MSKAKAKKEMGRPKVKIDTEQLLVLAKAHCTEEEIAQVLGISERTVIRRLKEPEFAEVIAKGKAFGKVSLRRLQWRHAQMPNSAGVTMAIHLSKHWLGETEKAAIEHSGRIDSAVEVTSARERVLKKLDDIHERIKGRVAGLAAASGATSTDREPVRD